MKRKIELMCGILRITPEDLRSSKRHRYLVEARQMIASILRKDNILEKIGEALGERHHSTVINMLANHEIDMKYDKYCDTFNNMEKRYFAMIDPDDEKNDIISLLQRNNVLLELILQKLD